MPSCEFKLMDCLWETSVTWQDAEVRCWRTQVSFVLQHSGKFRGRNCLFPSKRFHLLFWSPERCGRSVLAPNFGLKRQETSSSITRSYYLIIGRQNIRKKKPNRWKIYDNDKAKRNGKRVGERTRLVLLTLTGGDVRTKQNDC